jgi:hypothetical protein
MVVRRLLVTFWGWLRDWPERFAYAMALVVLGAHEPSPAPTGGRARWPNGEVPWCRRCDVVWPCEPAASVAALVDRSRQ